MIPEKVRKAVREDAVPVAGTLVAATGVLAYAAMDTPLLPVAVATWVASLVIGILICAMP